MLIGEPSEDILEFVKNNKLENRTVFTGRLNIPQSNYLIKNSIFCILPRITKHSSMKMIHYLIWGKPVLAKNIESNKEFVSNGVNGWLYSSEEELYKILKNILSKKVAISNKSLNVLETRKKILKIWEASSFLKKYDFNR